jgi:hypothetical protein
MPNQLKLAKSFKVKSRLCGDLTAINYHNIKKQMQMKHDQVCSYCGSQLTQGRCMVCPQKPVLHFFPSKGPNKEKAASLTTTMIVALGWHIEIFPYSLESVKVNGRRPQKRRKRIMQST